MIDASYEGICVEFKRKNNTIMVLLLLNCLQVLIYFVPDPLNIIFDNFCM